jgi:anti-sigma regulatory factor (Ser/Thr protein kinase)
VPELGNYLSGMATRTETSGPGGQSIVDVRLARDNRAPDRARRTLEILRPWVDASTLDDVTLLVSELVTNSVQHAGPDPDSWVGVRLTLVPGAVKGEVADPGPGFVPAPQPGPHERTSGHGLYLVGLISDRWGVSTDGITRVWFEVGASARREGKGGRWKG